MRAVPSCDRCAHWAEWRHPLAPHVTGRNVCGAQGFRDTEVAYSTRECRRLFEDREGRS